MFILLLHKSTDRMGDLEVHRLNNVDDILREKNKHHRIGLNKNKGGDICTFYFAFAFFHNYLCIGNAFI